MTNGAGWIKIEGEEEENGKKLLKKLEETGRIQDVSEAFKEFSAENEWHKGKIESFLEEEKEVYDQYNVGDIVFVKEYLYKNGKKEQTIYL